jgi:hypothetical protein
LIYNDGALNANDLPDLMQAKFDLLNRSGLLHYEYATASFADVAGVSHVRDWVQRRRAVFLDPSPTPALDPPKGVLLLGVQGCGKSLASKAIAGGFGVPLIRLDFGSLYDKYQGETEKNLREALSSCEVLAPCVLWIDEIEKGLAGGGDDGGVSRRVLGYLLTWMAERKAKVFVVATANAVNELPAELLRKGRFDEIFFVDLPRSDLCDAFNTSQTCGRILRPERTGRSERRFLGCGNRTGRGQRALRCRRQRFLARSSDATQCAARYQTAFRVDARASRRAARMGQRALRAGGLISACVDLFQGLHR